MNHYRLKKLPSWLVLAPWMVVICALLLAVFVLGLGLKNARRESAFTMQLTLEKGAAVILALEGALKSGMGFQWSDEQMQDVLEKMGRQPDMRYTVITNMRGTILAASEPELTGRQLLSPQAMAGLRPGPEVQGYVERELSTALDGRDAFLVYRQLTVPRFDERLERGHHMMMMRQRRAGMAPPPPPPPSMSPEDGDARPGQSLVVFLGYDTSPLLSARRADADHTYTISAVLIFVAIVGALSWFLVQAYRQSRRMVMESRALASELVSTLPVGILATDDANRVTTLNSVAARILGLSRADISGKDLPLLLPQLWQALAPSLERGLAVTELELRLAVAGRRVPLAVSASRIVTEEGLHIGNAVILRDLGEIRHLQAELRHRERLAAMGNMAAGIAHEIRNPLGAIKGLARFFAESHPDDSEEGRVAAIMTREVMRLDKVVGDLLDFSRPDHLDLQPVSPGELAELARRAERLVREDMEKQGVTFRLEAAPEWQGELLLDPDRFTQVLLNLYLNAIQAMPQGGSLTVETRPAEGFLEIRISDTGCGIPQNKAREIFTPYFTTKAQGTGLGLSIVHKILEPHEADIEVQSEPGHTTFLLRFPLRGA